MGYRAEWFAANGGNEVEVGYRGNEMRWIFQSYLFWISLCVIGLVVGLIQQDARLIFVCILGVPFNCFLVAMSRARDREQRR